MLRCLLFVGLWWCATLTAAAQDPTRNDHEKLFQKGIQAITDRNLDAGIEAFEKCLQLDEKDSASCYNLACCYALKGKPAEGLQWLRKAYECGFTDWQHTEKDEDLTALRAQEGYRALIDEMKGAAARNEVREYRMHTPASYDGSRPFPLVIALHGAGGNADHMIELWKKLAEDKGILIAAVQGTVKVRQDSYRWDDRSEGVVLAILREVQEKYKVDAARVVLCGFSQGAYLSWITALRSPDQFRGVVCFGGLYPAAQEVSYPEALKHGLRVYLVHGAQDADSLPAARTAAQQLKTLGVPCQLHQHEGGHEIPAAEWPDLGPRVWDWIQAGE